MASATWSSLHFPSVHALCQHIQHSKDATGTWIRYPGASHSIQAKRDMLSLDYALEQAQSCTGLDDVIRAIATLSTQLSRSMPAPQTIRAQRVWGKQGSTLNPHRVLRGNTTPWKRTIRRPQPATGRILNIAIPLCWPFHAKPQQILWSAVASLAYADLCIAAGYLVNVYALSVGRTLFTSGRNDVTTVVLHRSDQPWNVQSVAVATQEWFLRRLIFRTWEQATVQHGATTDTYGPPVLDPHEVLAALVHHASCPDLQRTPLELGAMEHDNVTDMPSAQHWLDAKIQALDAA